MNDWSTNNRDAECSDQEEDDEEEILITRPSGNLDISNVQEQVNFVETPFTIAARRAVNKKNQFKLNGKQDGDGDKSKNGKVEDQNEEVQMVPDATHSKKNQTGSNIKIPSVKKKGLVIPKDYSIGSDSSSYTSSHSSQPLPPSSNSSPLPRLEASKSAGIGKETSSIDQFTNQNGTEEHFEGNTSNFPDDSPSHQEQESSQESSLTGKSQSLSLTGIREGLEKSFDSSQTNKSSSKYTGMKPANVRLNNVKKGQSKLSLAPCPASSFNSSSSIKGKSGPISISKKQKSKNMTADPRDDSNYTSSTLSSDFKTSHSTRSGNRVGLPPLNLTVEDPSSTRSSPYGQELFEAPPARNPSNFRDFDRRQWRDDQGDDSDRISDIREVHSNERIEQENDVLQGVGGGQEELGNQVAVEEEEIFAFGLPEVDSNSIRNVQSHLQPNASHYHPESDELDFQGFHPYNQINHFEDEEVQQRGYRAGGSQFDHSSSDLSDSMQQVPRERVREEYTSQPSDSTSWNQLHHQTQSQPTFTSLPDIHAIAKTPLKLSMNKRSNLIDSNMVRSQVEPYASTSCRQHDHNRSAPTSLQPRVSRRREQEKAKQDLANRMEIENDGIKSEEWGTLWLNSKLSNEIGASVLSNSVPAVQASTPRRGGNKKPFRTSLLPALQAQIPATPIRGNLAISGKSKRLRLPFFSTPMQVNARRDAGGGSSSRKSGGNDSQLVVSEERFYDGGVEEGVDNERISSGRAQRVDQSPSKKRTKLTLFEPTPLKESNSPLPAPTASNPISTGSKTSSISQMKEILYSKAGLVKEQSEADLQQFEDSNVEGTSQEEEVSDPQQHEIARKSSIFIPQDLSLLEPPQELLNQDDQVSESEIDDQSGIFTSTKESIPSVEYEFQLETTLKDWNKLYLRSKQRFHLDSFAREVLPTDKHHEEDSLGEVDDRDDLRVSIDEGKMKAEERIKQIDPYLLKAHRDIVFSLLPTSGDQDADSVALDEDQLRMKAGIGVLEKVEKMVENL